MSVSATNINKSNFSQEFSQLQKARIRSLVDQLYRREMEHVSPGYFEEKAKTFRNTLDLRERQLLLKGTKSDKIKKKKQTVFKINPIQKIQTITKNSLSFFINQKLNLKSGFQVFFGNLGQNLNKIKQRILGIFLIKNLIFAIKLLFSSRYSKK